ncbi:hypothetical protein VPHD81_0008 [Vibrio phage D81]
MWRRLKNMETPKVGDSMVLVEAAFGGKVDGNSNRLDGEVTESTEHFFTIKANGQNYQFAQQTWQPIALRPKYYVFKSHDQIDQTHEASVIRAKIAVAFNFTHKDRGEFTLEQLRNAAKALELKDV